MGKGCVCAGDSDISVSETCKSLSDSLFELIKNARIDGEDHSILRVSRIMTDFASFPRVEPTGAFGVPSKQINSDTDVAKFNRSVACERIVGFILLLNEVVKGRSATENFQQSEPIIALGRILDELNAYIDGIPPSTGPRRFGNVAFRQWVKKMEQVIAA